MQDNREVLLNVEDLCMEFRSKSRRGTSVVKAIDHVSFQVYKSETFGLVGESGCGKTTTGRAILRLYNPTSGKIELKGRDISGKMTTELRQYIAQNISTVFQDPVESLNPRMTVREIISEGLVVKGITDKAVLDEKVKNILEKVGLTMEHANRYPHEFSGGQRQRIGIARAIVLGPSLIVCDEPVSALDVSIQSQVLNLLTDLQESMGMAYIFISHNLSVIKHISDRVMVMYLGHVVEMADKKELFDNPSHPYTQALLYSIPLPERHSKRKRILLQGDLPSPANPPSGCVFHTRCFMAKDICKTEKPELKDIGNGHMCACHFCEKCGTDSLKEKM